MKILFQGDSVTDGNRYKSKASEWDKNHQIGHSYVYIVTGLLGASAPERRFSFINRGVSGNTVAELASRWQQDALEVAPDVLSVLIGVNDCLRASARTVKDLSASDYEKTYREILTASRRQNPALKLVLLEPFAYTEHQQNAGGTPALRKAILQSEQKAVRRLADEFNAVFIPLQSVFDEAAALREPSYWIWDGTHPTEAGHALIAREFLKATKDIFGAETFDFLKA
ncbi:MAG: SGNH/GDSL hydrolase family protein [Clostridia bacterium]|nr:SGNH/GDSL hydrolase family protein [Clostridia bacterium]